MFGFSPSEYEVHENAGSVMIEIFIRGIPGDYQPAVVISTHNGTATGQHMQLSQIRPNLYSIISCAQKGEIFLP